MEGIYIKTETYEQMKEQLRQLSAALAVKDEALEVAVTTPFMGQDIYTLKVQDAARKALAIQPHASILNKIRADAVRELYDWFMDQETFNFLNEEAIETYFYQHLEKGEA